MMDRVIHLSILPLTQIVTHVPSALHHIPRPRVPYAQIIQFPMRVIFSFRFLCGEHGYVVSCRKVLKGEPSKCWEGHNEDADHPDGYASGSDGASGIAAAFCAVLPTEIAAATTTAKDGSF